MKIMELYEPCLNEVGTYGNYDRVLRDHVSLVFIRTEGKL
jgi:hypothetical protein